MVIRIKTSALSTDHVSWQDRAYQWQRRESTHERLEGPKSPCRSSFPPPKKKILLRYFKGNGRFMGRPSLFWRQVPETKTAFWPSQKGLGAQNSRMTASFHKQTPLSFAEGGHIRAGGVRTHRKPLFVQAKHKRYHLAGGGDKNSLRMDMTSSIC